MGSSCSYLQKHIAEQLQVPFHQKSTNAFKFLPTLQTKIHSFGNNEVFNLHNIFVGDHLNLNSAEPQALNLICQHQHPADVSFPILPDNSVTVLLGQDNIDLITPEWVIKGNNNSPGAIQTKLGWTIAGPNRHRIPLFAPQPLTPPRYPIIN